MDGLPRNITPDRDGQVAQYLNEEAAQSQYWDRGRTVIFINGMGNSGADHRASALSLSLLQMCRVVGVYNQTGGFLADLSQCLADKYQFDGPLADAPPSARSENVLSRNPAAVALFTLLRLRQFRHAAVFAHSQGNLILSNVLSAIKAVDGADALAGRAIHTFGSPSVNWPSPVRPLECGFTWDPVTWLAGFDFSFSISKVGMPGDSLNPITHAFAEYVKSDPAFVINRFRWGGLGVTVSMDEAGLARALAAMGPNMPRVTAVFQRLRRVHPSDVDDVAERYVEAVGRLPNAQAVFQAIKSSGLADILIDAMERGWTSRGERAAIEHLRGL